MDKTMPGYGHLDCNRTNYRLRNNGAFANYNALQMNITTRNFHGLTTNTNFTYSKAIDNSSEIFGTFAGGNTITFAENPLNPNQPERAVSGISMKYIGSSDFSYKLPSLHNGSGFMGRLLGGYRIDTIWTFNTGQPVSAYQFGFFGNGPVLQSYADASFDGAFNSSVDNIRPILNNSNAPITSVGILDDGSICGVVGFADWATCNPGQQSDFHWLRNTQYAANTLLKNPYGGVGRGSIRGWSWNNYDVALQKETKLTERLTMVLAVLSFDALNRQYLGAPDTFVDDVGGSFMDYRYNYGGDGHPFGNGGTRNTQLKASFRF
jgi:hypothetical protein